MPELVEVTRAPTTHERARAALGAVMQKLCDEITSAPDGAQNNTINSNALRAFRLALWAEVDLDEVERDLVAACERGNHPEAATRATLSSARAAAEREGPAELRDRRAPGARGRRVTDHADVVEGNAGQEGGMPDDGRPRVIVGPDLHRVVADAIGALGAHPSVYQRRGVGLVRILAAPGDSADPGAPIIDPLPRPVLASMLSEVAQWVGFDRKGEPRQVQPTEPAVAAVHAWAEFPATVRHLRGIVEAPTMRRDGSIATAPGYDAPSGLYVHWEGAELDVPERPTRKDAHAAFNELAALFSDFRFAGDEAAQRVARAGVVAAMLSPLAREAIDGPCPAFVFEADGPNAGKTLAASVCGALAAGRIPAVRQHTADDDETAKRIASIAIAGHPIALFDNVRVHVEGGALEAALSAHNTIAARILGRSEDRELPWRTVLFLTMNAASYSADVARRVVHIAMRGRPVDLDSPAAEFTIPELARHVIANRAELLRAAFTILRAHQIAGRPMPGATLPTFEAWSRVVAGAVCWASGFDPVRARPPESANRDANVARVVTITWAAAFPDGEALRVGRVLEMTRAATVDRPGASGPARSAALAALRDALADLAGAPDPGRITPGSLGKLLASRVVGRFIVDPNDPGRRIGIVPDGMEHGSQRYRAAVEVITPAPSSEHETAVFPSDHPTADATERGGYGFKGASGKRPYPVTGDEKDVETWDA